MTDFAPLYYPLKGSTMQPQFAVMYRALFCIVADANAVPGLPPEERYYIGGDENPLRLLDHRGWEVATLLMANDGYQLTSANVPLRKRADTTNGTKHVISSKSAQYIVEALQRHRRGLLATNSRILTEVSDLFQSSASHVNHDVYTQHGQTPTTINVTLSGALFHVIGEVMNGRMTVDQVDPEHRDRLNAFLDGSRRTLDASHRAFERHKAFMTGEKWVVVGSRNGLHVGAYRSEKVDGAGVFRNPKDILTIEPLRLYTDMDDLKEKNPAAYGDISVGVADALALAKTTGVRIFRPNIKGIEEIPYPFVEEAGFFMRMRPGIETWAFMTDKRS